MRCPFSINSAPKAMAANNATSTFDTSKLFISFQRACEREGAAGHHRAACGALSPTTRAYLVQNGISDQTRNGTAMMYSAHTMIFTSLFWTKFSGSNAPMIPKAKLATRHVAVQPYQYMAGPSPLRAAAQKRSTRLVPGWYVNSGRLKMSQIT